jgi:hypothetical protein
METSTIAFFHVRLSKSRSEFEAFDSIAVNSNLSTTSTRDVSGSQGDECEDYCLLRRCTVSCGRNIPTFQRRLLPQSSQKRVNHRPDDGGSKILWNIGKLTPDYTAQQPRRQPSSYSSPWEPEISQGMGWFCQAYGSDKWRSENCYYIVSKEFLDQINGNQLL